MNKSESNIRELELLADFTTVASATNDIRSLMTHFFNLLRRESGFDIGAYLVTHESHIEGRVYAPTGLDRSVVEKFSRYVRTRSSDLCPALAEPRVPTLAVSALAGGPPARPSDAQGRSNKVLRYPIECWGSASGVIYLAALGASEIRVPQALMTRMTDVVNRVLERLFTNMFAQEKKLTDVLFSMTEGVYIVDRAGSFAAINPKGFELLSSFCGMDMEQIKSGLKVLSSGGLNDPKWDDCEFIKFVRRALERGDELGAAPYSEEISNGKGRLLVLSANRLEEESAWKLGYVITAKDVTDERVLQEKMILSSKLASLGEMAAGIAHEINNPLQAILLNIEMLKLNAEDKSLKRLESIEDGITRIKTIVKDLLIFAREDTTDTENVDVNILIEKAVDILRHQLKVASVSVGLELEKRPLIVECNRNLFQQVIINLLQNAKDAIEESGKGGSVCIRSALADGGIRITVTDDGPGISPDIIDRIFDPFLTTKDVGKGTGLGLSVSRKIIEGIGGQMSVRSRHGEFAEFTIDVPHTGKVMDERRKRRRREPDCSLLADKSVLMVDDETEVLSTVRESIGKYVTTMDTHTESSGALRSLRERDYDLILLDIKMPGTGGMELFRMITREKPHLAERVIFLSGDTESEKTGEFLNETRCMYLSKPFSAMDLLSVMCEALVKDEACAEG